MPRGASKGTRRPDPAEARAAAFAAVRASDLFGPLLRRAHPVDLDAWGIRSSTLRRGGLLAVDAHGGLVYNGRAEAEVEAWTWSISHALTHLGLGHTDAAHRDGRGSYSPEWRAACCVAVDRFLGALHLPGTPRVPPGFEGDEEQLARRFSRAGVPPILAEAGPAGAGPDLWEDLFEGRRSRPPTAAPAWGRIFAAGLETAIPAEPIESPQHLALPPPSWDTRLTAWLDERIPALGRPPVLALDRSSAGDLAPRGSLVAGPPSSSRSFGVVLAASGSMDQGMIGRALGSLASSARAKDVRSVRVVYCDAAPRDAGWLPPDQIAPPSPGLGGRTVLQPGVDLLLTDPTFPADRPILLITDGDCDHVRLRRDHAWLTAGDLPFTPRGPVFRLA